MRINADLLFKVARDYVKEQTRGVHDIVSIYAQGSLLGEEPLIGGAGDIDLVFIRDRMMLEDVRQIIRVTDDICMDIIHTPREKYRQARDLRVHPWLGPVIYSCKIMYDPQHFMDFVQASVRGQFERTDNIALRSRRLLEQARQEWMNFQGGAAKGQPDEMWRYLRSVEAAINALVVLKGAPLTERRFLLRFPEYAAALGHPGLNAALQGLIGVPNCRLDQIKGWIESWEADFREIPAEKAEGYLDHLRSSYYSRFFEAIITSETYAAVLWPLLNIWTASAAALPADSARRENWHGMVHQLNLSGEGFESRLEALDTFLDTGEEILEEWSRANGA